MKRFLLTLLVFAAGIALGCVAGHFVTVVRYGIKESRISRVYEEGRVTAFGSNAFGAYLNEAPEVGIYALKAHLNDLDQQEHKWGTNWAILQLKDLNYMRATAHARLANLYAKTGRLDLSSNETWNAWQAYSATSVHVRGVTNSSDFANYVQDRDSKRSWW
jgi:hypothetical protein